MNFKKVKLAYFIRSAAALLYFPPLRPPCGRGGGLFFRAAGRDGRKCAKKPVFARLSAVFRPAGDGG